MARAWFCSLYSLLLLIVIQTSNAEDPEVKMNVVSFVYLDNLSPLLMACACMAIDEQDHHRLLETSNLFVCMVEV